MSGSNDIEKMVRIAELIAHELGTSIEQMNITQSRSFMPAEIRAVVCIIAKHHYNIHPDTIAEFLGFKTINAKAPRHRQINARISKYLSDADKFAGRLDRLRNVLDYLGLDDSCIDKACDQMENNWHKNNPKEHYGPGWTNICLTKWRSSYAPNR